MKKILIFLITFLLSGTCAFSEEGIRKEELRKLLGETYIMEGDYDKAIDQYMEILKKDPSNLEVRVLLADVLSWQKKYEESIKEYNKVLESEPGNIEVKIKLARVYLWNRDYKKSQEIYKDIIKEDPHNMEAKELIADSYAYSKEFDKAIALYRELLSAKYDRGVKIKLADTLSWNKKYNEALKFYDELIDEKADLRLKLQKARILGWARKYRESLKEYQSIVDTEGDELAKKEMQAKRAYWNNRVKQAIICYRALIDEFPNNLEAMFDLSQIYSYQSMWSEAMEGYKNILNRSPNHFRAKEGLKKAEHISENIALKSGYEFFEADSSSRDSDIKKSIFFNNLNIPLARKSDLKINYNLTGRQFSDFSDVIEHEGGIGFAYRHSPDWAVDSFYNFIEYDKDIETMHEFGGIFKFRIFDVGESLFSFERNRLENNSVVIRNKYSCDNYKIRADFDITKKLKIGADYLYSGYSDDNYKNEPGGDILYYLSLEPKALYVKYEYFFRDFDKKVNEYFSPHDFSTHTITVNWRHYLNKEEVYFGAADLYYDLRYGVSLDSDDIVGHKFTAGFTWDINERLQIKTEGQYVHSSASVYEDKRALVSAKYYF
ncbi:MAG: tetratricopeptide repeat protein [Candidatus Omnitrophota bacterium]|nr:MAG: tetratricopeptide repeat protein [Candidatus Omnitrophota bacterium]